MGLKNFRCTPSFDKCDGDKLLFTFGVIGDDDCDEERIRSDTGDGGESRLWLLPFELDDRRSFDAAVVWSIESLGKSGMWSSSM